MIKIAIDCAVFCYDHGTLKVLLSKKSHHTNAKWGILRGMLEDNESADDAAFRLAQESGAEKYILSRQLKTFTDPNQQDSQRNITIGYYVLINIDKYKTIFGSSSSYKRWWKVTDVPDLLFNQKKIIDLSLYQIGNVLRDSAVGFELLPKEFTLTELTNLYREILGVEGNESSFCKKILQKKIIVPIVDEQKSTEIETQRRYKFNEKEYEKLTMEKNSVIF